MYKNIDLDQLAATNALLKTETLAALADCSVSTIEKSRKTGELLGVPSPPYVRIGKSVRYPAKDFKEWQESLPRFKHEAEEFVSKQQAAGGKP
jgi:predicted DNA-binding transcriptional regulator AlpA